MFFSAMLHLVIKQIYFDRIGLIALLYQYHNCYFYIAYLIYHTTSIILCTYLIELYTVVTIVFCIKYC